MTPMEISERIRKALKASGRKSPDVAGKLGIEPTSLRLFKNGTRPLSFDVLSKLADELGLEITVQERKRRV